MNLNQMLQSTVKEHARADALIFNNENITYKELNERIRRLAHMLATLGIKHGDRVVLVLRNSPEFVISYFAILQIGAIAVPVNFLLKPPEIEYILSDSKAVGIITHLAFFKNVKKAGKNLSDVRFFILVGDPAQIKTSVDGAVMHQAVVSYNALMREPQVESPADDGTAIDPEELAIFIYTSGTTGRPKGVMLTHHNLFANLKACHEVTGVSGKDRFICILPMFHSFAWLVCILLPVYLGASIVIIESIQPFGRVMKAIFRHKVTIMVGVPQIYSALTKLPFIKPLHVFIPIRLCISGAAPLPLHVLEKFQNKFSLLLIEGYGLTEASPVVTLNPVKGLRKPGSIGIPLPGVQVKIRDENGTDVSGTDKVGEIYVQGPNVMKGYYAQPEATAGVLSQDGWLKTGDMGYSDSDGYIFIVDRKKDLIISKGLNIYPKEVEDVLISHPAVLEAAVIGIVQSDGDETISAYVTFKENKSASEKELSAFCRKNIASYKVPRAIYIVSELPKNTLGKVLKTELRAKAAHKNIST